MGEKEAIEDIKEDTQKVFAYDWTEAGHDAATKFLNIDEEIAYGDIHSAVSIISTITAYTAMSIIPSGQIIAAIAGATSVGIKTIYKGTSAEENLIRGTSKIMIEAAGNVSENSSNVKQSLVKTAGLVADGITTNIPKAIKNTGNIS